ncbi:MAG: tryptophan--tRNA ligase [Saprospiraceae bacterium]|jgi:tryptophanyl-tRNA synthetase|nr:tryptophan--tRNA ligase [Saprospiraceae bacterium]MBP9209601.1 tryptophan--tRNA ligase [Saprospiraceae bacterium]MBV6472534.1 Tryptophan--tRNA ligase [Saprospiraceae bacterium]
MTSPAKIVLSGIQPTGKLHFGRYFGAVQNWIELQSSYDCVFSVVDYHAMTMPYSPAQLRENVWDLAINLLACGIREENLFIQSLVPEHTELAWILACNCSYGELSRMTQFKDKTQQLRDKDKDLFVSAGLFIYPVLQAADILIYRADCVPVGKDQEQHLELTRNIAERFNHIYRTDYFTLPEPLFTEVPKVMSTADPLRKMSASAGEKHYVDVFAAPDQIRKQVRSAVTDTGQESGNQMSPGVENLFMLLRAAHSPDTDELLEAYKGGTLAYSKLKEQVAEALVSIALPFQEEKRRLLEDKKAIKDRIKRSSAHIRERAARTLSEVKAIVGLGQPLSR